MTRRPRFPRPAGYHWDRAEPVVRADGLPPCRWCKGAVRPPRKAWCGRQECQDRWALRTAGQSGCRSVCESRDRGVCALCGLDVIKVKAEYDEIVKIESDKLLSHLISGFEIPRYRAVTEWIERTRWQARCIMAGCPEGREFAARVGIPWSALLAGRTLWEADHIVPIVDGGDPFDPANLRTLCIACHERETSRQARERALSNSLRSNRIPP